jgi:SAM-dependent methyltransferase
MADRPFAEYAARNIPPILEVLQREFCHCRRVLEIGSGTGQHAVAFATALPHLRWQTSDLVEHHAGINARLESASLENVMAPLEIDVRNAILASASFDAVYTANTAHIMSLGAVQRMFSLAGKVLRKSGVFCLYGPFRVDGGFNAASNADFDRSLRNRSAEMGIRDLEMLDSFGVDSGLYRQRLYAVPSNNFVAIYKRREGT